jgi:MFS family permease
VIAPNTLALITTTFPEGQPRNRAMGVYSAMAGGGGAVGLLLGGLLTGYVSWRWVLFVNVPIGIAVAAAARRVLAESPLRPGAGRRGRRGQRHRRRRVAGVRPVQGGHRAGRGLALG